MFCYGSLCRLIQDPPYQRIFLIWQLVFPSKTSLQGCLSLTRLKDHREKTAFSLRVSLKHLLENVMKSMTLLPIKTHITHTHACIFYLLTQNMHLCFCYRRMSRNFLGRLEREESPSGGNRMRKNLQTQKKPAPYWGGAAL